MSDFDAPPAAFQPVFDQAILRILQGEAIEPFCDWFSRAMGAFMQAEAPLPAASAADGARYQRHVARILWHGLPVPGNRWRPRPAPKAERNNPCPCGSGRKYKQCCAEFAHVQPPFATDDLLVLALSHADPSMLQPAQARQVPAEALGVAAQAWNAQGRPEHTVAVLEPLFERLDGLDGRHEIAFDQLMDALQMTGQEVSRHALAQRVAQSRDKDLACSARARMVTMLADRGEERAAWAMFQETQRLYPDNPQLWHLELTLLLAEGRTDEARMRSVVLAAKARRAGLMDLADVLVDLGEQGLGTEHAWRGGDDVDDLEDEQWVALCDQAPDGIDEAACRALYKLERSPAHGEDEPPVLSIAPQRPLADLQRRWSRRFGCSKPVMTELFGEDAEPLLDALPEAGEFLRDHPTAWLSIEVLDDLLLAAADICDPDAPKPVRRGVQRLVTHAMNVLRALVGPPPVRLIWMDAASRPPLRLLAQAIDFARAERDVAEVERLIAWSLQLNPNDNHGWRAVLAPMLLGQQRYAEALELAERYPNDMPPMEHHRALALFGLGRREEAEAVLRAAHARYPAMAQSLLPDVLDAPEPGDGPSIAVGALEQAWEFRSETRPAWVRSGALDWLRQLELPPPEVPARKKGRKAAPRKAAPAKVTHAPATFRKKDEAQLRKGFADYPRVHGFLTAMAWSPDIVMPTRWLEILGPLRVDPEHAPDLLEMQADLDALMNLHNAQAERLLTAAIPSAAPVDDVLDLAQASPDALYAWAAGFVQGAELAKGGWREAGHPLKGTTGAFPELYRLAARAPRGPDGWQALSEQAQPLLHELQQELAPPEALRLALDALWRAVAPLRQHGAFR